MRNREKEASVIFDPTNLEADLALTPLPLSLMQADHEGLVALLPVESHGLVALAECFDFILLHVGDNLKTEQKQAEVKERKSFLHFQINVYLI